MQKQLWNEGRVVGCSAYEIYVKHALSVDPDHEPATEKEWLASMMAMGSSMLLRIGIDPEGSDYDGLHYRDIQFPEKCRLCAANTIMASFFDGEGYVGTSNPADNITGWATKVTSYGPLIVNNPGGSPSGTVGPNDDIYPTNITAINNVTAASRIKEYVKIVDGIIIQPGTWVLNHKSPPRKDFSPTLSEHPRLRIAFKERINKPFFILLTGFTNRAIVEGVTGFESAVNTQFPADGDFLGPMAFPWANKVIFSISPAILNVESIVSGTTIGLNLDDSGHALSCFTSVDNETITALSMVDSDGDPYSLSGSSGDVPITLTPSSESAIGAKDITYTGYLNWDNLIQMLHNNKRAKISFTANKVDLTTCETLDITNVFSGAGVSLVSFRVGLGGVTKTLLLDTYDGTSALNTAENAGYFKVLLRMYPSPFGTTSKFVIVVQGYLKADVTVKNNTSGSKFKGAGVAWRGVKPDGIATNSWKPLFGTESPGTDGDIGTSVIKLWDSVPEIGYSVLKNSVMTATTHPSPWGLNVTIQYNGIVGDGNNNQIRLIDRSYAFNKGDCLITYLGENIEDDSATWYASRDRDGNISMNGTPAITCSYSGMYTTI